MEKDLERKKFFSHGSVHSRGVAILIHEDGEAEIEKVVIDPNGRYLLVEGKMAENQLAICNDHAPTSDKIREQLDKQLMHV